MPIKGDRYRVKDSEMDIGPGLAFLTIFTACAVRAHDPLIDAFKPAGGDAANAIFLAEELASTCKCIGKALRFVF